MPSFRQQQNFQQGLLFLQNLYKKTGMNELTLRQQEIFAFLKAWIAENGMPPTRAEMCAAMGFRSPNAAEEHLRALERKGVIEMLAGSSRGIRIREGGAMGSEAANDEEGGMPLIGKVAAGSPILAQENVIGRYPVSPLMFKPKADYLLKVSGMSMKDVGIMDGDWLAVHKTNQARTGRGPTAPRPRFPATPGSGADRGQRRSSGARPKLAPGRSTRRFAGRFDRWTTPCAGSPARRRPTVGSAAYLDGRSRPDGRSAWAG